VQFLAGLETHRLAGRDADFGTGAGIATDAGFARANAENAKSAQFDTLTGCQGRFEAFEDGIHGRLSLGAGKTSALDNVMDDVLLNQWGNLAGATRIDSTTPYSGDATDFAGILEQQKGIKVFFLLRKREKYQARSVANQRGLFSIVSQRERFVR
jgi:hypothetical protein